MVTTSQGEAIDMYHRFKEDIAFGEMGFKTYRLSIAWSFFLSGMRAQRRAWNFTKTYLRECHKYGIEPLVTITHFDRPVATSNWSNMVGESSHAIFTSVSAALSLPATGFGHWLTFNEINMILHTIYGSGGSALKKAKWVSRSNTGSPSWAGRVSHCHQAGSWDWPRK